MGKLNEIKRKRLSTQKTAQITRALELVSSSKLGQVTKKSSQGKQYAKQLKIMIEHLVSSRNNQIPSSAYIMPRGHKAVVGMIIVSSDRGLCGNLNNALFKKVVEQMQQHQQQGKKVILCTIGEKAKEFCKQFNLPTLGAYAKPKLTEKDALKVCEKMLFQYTEKNIAEIHLFYNEMISILEQRPVTEKLLPLNSPTSTAGNRAGTYIVEPSQTEVFHAALERYIRFTIYQAILENITSEEAARMIAMKNATDNANKIIDSLQLSANKARQAQITTELSEIIGGSEAIH